MFLLSKLTGCTQATESRGVVVVNYSIIKSDKIKERLRANQNVSIQGLISNCHLSVDETTGEIRSIESVDSGQKDVNMCITALMSREDVLKTQYYIYTYPGCSVKCIEQLALTEELLNNLDGEDFWLKNIKWKIASVKEKYNSIEAFKWNLAYSKIPKVYKHVYGLMELMWMTTKENPSP